MSSLLREAASLDPGVPLSADSLRSILPPWHDASHRLLSIMRGAIPGGDYDYVVLVPFGKLGGADYVAGLLARELSALGRTLILRTDASDWRMVSWYPSNVAAVDLSRHMRELPSDVQARSLFLLVRELDPLAVFNVNSRMGFEMLRRHGRHLNPVTQLFAYYFTVDFTPEGREAGYPVDSFQDVLPHLAGALFDNSALAERLKDRYQPPPTLQGRMKILRTPVEFGSASASSPAGSFAVSGREASVGRTRVVWAGRFDRQKRFDLMIEITRRLPNIHFDCWGTAVLDGPPNLDHVPANVTMHAPFTSYEDLDLPSAALFLYTSAWDGLPTILLEIGARQVPVVASAVGGVPELITSETGWPVDAAASAGEYAQVIQWVVEHPDEARVRANALARFSGL